MQNVHTAQGGFRQPQLEGVITFVLALWFIVMAAAVYGGYMITAVHSPPLPILLAIVIPLVAFGLAYAFWPAFKDYILSRDIVLLTAAQATRVVGFVFLGGYAYGLLPGVFAWPAGLGDVAVGVGSVFLATALAANTGIAATRGFVVFHWLGILDFVIAVGTGVIASGAFPELAGGGVTTAPLEVMPLGIIPAFFVPFYVILHISALLKVHHQAGQSLTRSHNTAERV